MREVTNAVPMSTSRQLFRLSVLAILACALVYAVALGTHWGLHADERAFPTGTGGPTWERAHVPPPRAGDPIPGATGLPPAGAAPAAAPGPPRVHPAAARAPPPPGANPPPPP